MKRRLYIPLVDIALQGYLNSSPSQSRREEKGIMKNVITEEIVENSKEEYPRRSSRPKKFTKSMKEVSSDSHESDGSFSSEEERTKQRKKKYKKTESSKKKKPMSAYELMIQKNREEKMAILQSLGVEEAKAGFNEILEKMRPVKRKIKKKIPPEPRSSRRLAKVKIDLCEKTLYRNALNKALNAEEGNDNVLYRAVDSAEENPQIEIPRKMTFKEALETDDIFETEDLYESYKVDVNIQESKPGAEFTIYDKSVLDEMILSNKLEISPARVTALTWYPSPEYMIIAVGDKNGELNIWNIESEDPYFFKIHLQGITNLQFSPYNQAHLISSSYDGILRCGDMVQHNFSELYQSNNKTSCTYFDILSASTYLVAEGNGQVSLADKRITKSRAKYHACHDHSIRTVNIHPIDNNIFVTADVRGSIRLWDLRKLQSTPLVGITHCKYCVNSAFFSPITGNSILACSVDRSISIFDSKNLSDIKVRVQKKLDIINYPSISRASWLPNSEETFVVGTNLKPRRIEVYDKNISIYSSIMHKNFTKVTTINAFHPFRRKLAATDCQGNVMVFI